MTEKRRKYTVEFKKEAVELVTRENYTVAEAASSLGISRSMLDRWRRETNHGKRMPSQVRGIKPVKLRN